MNHMPGYGGQERHWRPADAAPPVLMSAGDTLTADDLCCGIEVLAHRRELPKPTRGAAVWAALAPLVADGTISDGERFGLLWCLVHGFAAKWGRR